MHPPLLIFLFLVVSTLTLTLTLMLLLWVPFVCRFELKQDPAGNPVQRIKVRWMFLSRTIDGFAATGREDQRAGKVGKEMDVRRIFELFRMLHCPVTTLTRRVAQRIDFRELSCSATFGLDDPAEAGMLSGFLYAAFAPLTRSPAVVVRLHPVFHERTFAYHVRGSFGLTVGRMIIPLITFLCDRAVRGVIVERVRGYYLLVVQPGQGARKRLPSSC